MLYILAIDGKTAVDRRCDYVPNSVNLQFSGNNMFGKTFNGTLCFGTSYIEGKLNVTECACLSDLCNAELPVTKPQCNAALQNFAFSFQAIIMTISFGLCLLLPLGI